jgi:serine protease Do
MRTALPWLLVLALVWRLGQAGAAPAPAPAPAPGFADAVARAEPSIVHVSVQTHGTPPRSSRDDGVGSGFVFGADGIVLTSRHVVAGARAIFVDVPGRGTVEAQVLGHDETVDLTVLRVPLQGLTPLALGDSRALRVGDWVLSVGSPFRLQRSWSAGIVSGLHRTQVAVEPRAYEDFIQTDAAANLGNSGGPLLDAQGRAVGVLTQILTRSGGFQGVALATPIEAVLASASRIVARGGDAPPATLGIVVQERGVGGSGLGVEITRFQPGSAAQAAGLQVGDLITEVDGQRTGSTVLVHDVLRAHRAGDRVRVKYSRAGTPAEVEVLLR